jgi:flagellar hook-associated protein 2
MSSTSAVNTLLSSTTSTTPTYSISNILAASSGSSTTGIDVTSAVAAAIYADRAPERTWQADQTTLTSQTTALTAIQTATETLATDMQNLNTLTGPLAARTVTSSDSNDLSATAATGTATGTHTVVVNNLASTESWYSDLASSPTAELPTSSLTLTTTAGATATFATGTATTGTGATSDNLNALATAINGASLGVTATVVSDSTGSRLAIISNSSGTAAGFSITSANYKGTSWTSPDIPTGATLGDNSVTLKSSAGTVTINTSSGETYAQLATAINNATVATSYTSAKASLAGTTPLTAGSITTIQDGSTGNTFTYTAPAGATVADLNNAIANAVTAGTLSANVTGSVSGGNEVISEGTTDQGITVSTNDSVLGAMGATAGATKPLGLTATAGSDLNGTNLSIASSDGSSFTINEPAFGFTEAVAAANASLTVDGVPIQSASNTVTGAITGVTLNLLGSSSGSVIDLTVASDASSVSTAINQFVTDYNSALNLVNAQFTASTTTDSSGNATTSQGVLASDPTLVSLQGAMEQAISYVATPASGTTTTVSTLADLGITVGDDGTLTVDSTTLDNALTNDPNDVQNFFEGSALNGFANSLNNTLNTFTDSADGAFTVDLSSISAESSSITSEINDFETGYIASQQTLLTAEYSAAEVALQELPQQMQELNSELGFTNSGNNG